MYVCACVYIYIYMYIYIYTFIQQYNIAYIMMQLIAYCIVTFFAPIMPWPHPRSLWISPGTSHVSHVHEYCML